MGSITSPFPPRLDLNKDLEPGTQEWKLQCQSVRDALESHGCLLVDYDKISGELREEMFAAMCSLFDLPVKTKCKNASIGPFYTYLGPNQIVPHYETLAVMNAALPEKAQAFTDLMWPDGNDRFFETLNAMSKKMLDLVQIFMDIIQDSYGVERYQDWHVDSTNALFRMTKYSAPMRDEPSPGLTPHTDANLLTILCQNDVEGLLLKSRGGEWFPVNPGKGSFVVFVGQALRAWSNGRLYAPLHKVTISGDKDRFICGLFIMPKEDQIVQAPHELVGKEHPALFKPFTYRDFLNYSTVTEAIEGTLETFAGI